ncbi:uncharacterized protein LOC117120330 isoform X2 [Anneissia japonica]|uniref:uncharacterized protein LOC117120330 isoform X1 n=1 Tax=Anneissia japonica TaxID=1529436 RepID=UPI001425A751|nr:uncharacterized protein LOC117120330 isoform X1 [Anneissia japonica]XP_033121243.1 uncharacterized protein LOC117120330 isoform X1 [Anneissia japonica]XP_033121245.1 uncharacterized protein LOC117120330 isoform X2 [Anneissia japonica]
MTTNVQVQAPIAGQAVLYQPGPVHPPSSWNKKAALITGYMQIGLAVLSLAFGVACIFSRYYLVIIAFPIWAALGFYLVAGILGVVAGQSDGRNSCAIIGCLVMSILAAVTACAHIIVGSFSTEVGLYFDDYYFERDGWYVVNILSVLIGVAELVTAIVSSAFMCCGINCCCEQQTPNVVGQQQYASYVVQPGQVVNQGQVGVHGNPMMQQQVMVQPQQPLLVYTEHETKEVPQV